MLGMPYELTKCDTVKVHFGSQLVQNAGQNKVVDDTKVRGVIMLFIHFHSSDHLGPL